MRILDVLKPWYVFRDAVTGRFVSRVYALLHPTTTVRERVFHWEELPQQDLPPAPSQPLSNSEN